MKNALDNLMTTVKKTISALGKDIEAEAVKAAPLVTGNLRNSIVSGTPTKSGDTIELPISMTTYGIFVNEGTGLYSDRKAKYQILPKNKKALKTPYGIFTKVMHPGIKGQFFIQDAVGKVLNEEFSK